ncbi:MAG TPA: SMP-30/gluconolactonase/LRE family protein [Polyangia bacterium]|nr:SMP-30/gluconolactonase/LRE family protein [Polyangia bacterium]
MASLSTALAGPGCSSSGPDAGGSGGATGGQGTGGASTGGAPATGGSTGGTGTGGTGTGGTVGTGGAAGQRGTGGVGGAGTGGAAGQRGTGGAGGAGTGGAAGRNGTGGAGTGGAAGQRGTGGAPSGQGSAAKSICASGATYGNPLTGMGSVSSIAAPASDYFAFIEGPVWIGGLSTLFFSDNASSPSERIFKLLPPSTTPALFLGTSGSNGLGVDNSDRIIAADQRNKRIVRFDPMTGQVVGTPVSTGSAKPNDVIVRSDDNVYFTDPDSGFYRISPTGTVSAAMKLTSSSRPNGIELSLDENTLYVGDVGNRTIAKYTLAADGSIITSTGTNLVAQTMHDTVDGMCVDCAGNIYAGTSGGVEVYSPTGTYIGTVPTGESSNCTFGNADRKTLYVTSRSVLKAVTLSVPGLPD